MLPVVNYILLQLVSHLSTICIMCKKGVAYDFQTVNIFD